MGLSHTVWTPSGTAGVGIPLRKAEANGPVPSPGWRGLASHSHLL